MTHPNEEGIKVSKLFSLAARYATVYCHVHLHSQPKILVDGVSGDFQKPLRIAGG